MSNDYFKAQGWFKDYARNSQDSRGMFQRLVEQDESAIISDTEIQRKFHIIPPEINCCLILE